LKTLFKIIIIFMLAIGVMPGCSVSKESAAAAYAFDWRDFLRVDGSTVTEPITVALAIDLVGVDNDLFIKPDYSDYFYINPDGIKHNKTYEAFQNLLAGDADIIFIPYPPEEDLAAAKAKGIELESRPVANDAFVFIGNTNNPVKNLTKKQIQDIYEGKIQTWSELGGSDAGIRRIHRNEDSGSWSEMRRFMEGKSVFVGDISKPAPAEPQMNFFAAEMTIVLDSLSDTPNGTDAIGYSYYYYVNQQNVRENIRCFAINGIEPNTKTIQDKTYPECIQYYAFIRKDEPEAGFARMLLRYLLSAEGQASIEASGYVGL